MKGKKCTNYVGSKMRLIFQNDGMHTIVKFKGIIKSDIICAFFRAGGLTNVTTILDSSDVTVIAFDLATLPNIERVRFNSAYDVGL